MIGGTSWSGWGFHMRYFDDYSEEFYTVNEANSLSNSVLQTSPVFKISPLSYLSSNVTDSVIDEMLAMGIPSLSYPAGRKHITPLNTSGFSFDMNSFPDTFKPNGWVDRGNDYGLRWLHNDLKNVAFLYNYSLFKKLVNVGDL